MDGVIGPLAQQLAAKGQRREGDLNHQQNTVELNAMANLLTQKFVTRDPVVSFTSNLFSLGYYGVGQVKFPNFSRTPPQNLQMVNLVWVNAKKTDLKASNQPRF